MKRQAKKIISSVIYPISRLMKKPKNTLRILMYHAIEEKDRREDTLGIAVTPGAFKKQMAYIKENFNPVGLRESVLMLKENKELPERAVAVTFDDGYKSVKTEALPVLRGLNIPATVFINIFFIENRLSGHDYWDKWATLTPMDITEISKNGISIGSHGFTHRRLGGLDKDELIEEIELPEDFLKEIVKASVDTFSYPHGSFNGEIKTALKKKGYKCACSSIEGLNRRGEDLYELKRTEITAYDDADTFKRKLSGAYDWLGAVRRRR